MDAAAGAGGEELPGGVAASAVAASAGAVAASVR
jgi:hypothetical protein